jgi:hypothetical protein
LRARASLHALSLAEGVEQETKRAEPASVGPGSSLTRQPNTPVWTLLFFFVALGGRFICLSCKAWHAYMSCPLCFFFRIAKRQPVDLAPPNNRFLGRRIWRGRPWQACAASKGARPARRHGQRGPVRLASELAAPAMAGAVRGWRPPATRRVQQVRLRLGKEREGNG